MACSGISFGRITICSALALLVLLQATLVWEQALTAPAKKNDVLAGTEFLSVFINGAMAPRPARRRGSKRGNGHSVVADSVASESQVDEASIFRISTAPNAHPKPREPTIREEGARYYPISKKTFDNRHSFETLIDDLGTARQMSSKFTSKSQSLPVVLPASSNNTIYKNGKMINQKVIGVSVKSSVEATPYKVRVEHYDGKGHSIITRPPRVMSHTFPGTTIKLKSTNDFSPVKTTHSIHTTMTTKSSPPMEVTQSPAHLVTEELSNIVSESNRSEFSVDEGSPKTSWHDRTSITPKPTLRHRLQIAQNHQIDVGDSTPSGSSSEPVEQSYEPVEQNSEIREVHHIPLENHSHTRHQGRKIGRNYEDTSYNQSPNIYSRDNVPKPYRNPPRIYSEPAKIYSEPTKSYSEPEKVYSEPAKIYSEPAKVYSEPAKVYGEPSKVYGEPAKVYGEPEKVYSEPARIYSEPAKIYSEPAKVYSEPSKVYNSDGQPIQEPEEENYEIDEAVSVGSNGNVHGPQAFTEAPSTDPDDRHKIGYVIENRKFRKYMVEERTPDGFIIGEYGVVSHDDGSLRGVRYTADGTINPRLIHDALMKFLAL